MADYVDGMVRYDLSSDKIIVNGPTARCLSKGELAYHVYFTGAEYAKPKVKHAMEITPLHDPGDLLISLCNITPVPGLLTSCHLFTQITNTCACKTKIGRYHTLFCT